MPESTRLPRNLGRVFWPSVQPVRVANMAFMDAGFYEDIAGRLRGLLIQLDDRLSEHDLAWTAEFIDANELGLALDQMAHGLCEYDHPVTAGERLDMLALAERMQMGSGVARALSFCPEP